MKWFQSRQTNKHRIEKKLALDCGAGIGRVSKHLLLKNFEFVEMVDVTKNFIDQATTYLGEDSKRVLKFHIHPLQTFFPEPNKYDCIWIQWVLGYLTENDLVDFIKRCKLALKSSGIMIIKENIAQVNPEFDEVDCSWTRTRQQYINAIHKANLHLIKDEKQRKFPSELYEVRLFAFKWILLSLYLSTWNINIDLVIFVFFFKVNLHLTLIN